MVELAKSEMAAGIDWATGAWSAPDPVGKVDLSVTIASDWGVRRGAYEPEMLAQPEAIYGDLLPRLRGSDLSIVNVESVLANVGQPIAKDGPHMRGDPAVIRALQVVPFHVACLANNHALDYGPKALESTLAALRFAGLTTTGAGLDAERASEPAILPVKGYRLAIINCAEGEEARSRDGGPGVYGFEIARIERQIRALRQECDLVLVIFHGGRSYAPVPAPYVVQGLRRVAEAGADAVLAHHPHVPQGVEIYAGAPIAYSLGNFCWWQSSDLFYRRSGYLVRLDFSSGSLAHVELTPYLLYVQGLTSMPERLRAAFLEDLERVSKVLRRPEDISAAWDAFIDFEGGPAQLWRDLVPHIDGLDVDPAAHAPWLLNRLVTPAHRDLYERAARRLQDPGAARVPEWAADLVRRWRTLKFDEHVARFFAQ